MKMILLAVVPFVIGLAGATGIAVMNAPPPDPATDSAHAEGADHATGLPDVPGSAGGHADGSASDAAQDAASPSDQAEDAETTTTTPAAANDAAPEPQAGADSGFAEAGIARLSRILVNMKPKEAAQILGHLSDDEVDAILKAVGVRQAAALLTELPRERGAELSRRLIESTGAKP